MNIKSIKHKGVFNLSAAEQSRFWIDGDSTNLVIKQQKINEDNEYEDVAVYNMPIETFAEHPNFAEFSVFGVDTQRSINTPTTPSNFTNLLTYTLNTKNFLTGSLRDQRHFHNFLIVFPKAEASYDNAPLLLFNKDVYPVTFGEGTKITVPVVGPLSTTYSSEEESVEFSDYIPAISVTANTETVNAGDSVTLTLSSELSTVWVEPIIGTTNKTRVNMINGSGTLTVYTNDLQAGETVRIKFGSKYFTGISEYTKTLV